VKSHAERRTPVKQAQTPTVGEEQASQANKPTSTTDVCGQPLDYGTEGPTGVMGHHFQDHFFAHVHILVNDWPGAPWTNHATM